MSYTTALNRDELFENLGLRRDIPSLLHPEEEVLLVLPGVAGDYPDVMIATAQRCLLAAGAGPLKKAKIRRAIAAAEVAGVQYRPGLFTRKKVAPPPAGRSRWRRTVGRTRSTSPTSSTTSCARARSPPEPRHTARARHRSSTGPC